MQRHPETAKRPVNLSLSAAVLDSAKALGMNISQTVDHLLTEEVRRQQQARWAEENQEAIAAYNARIEREGTLSQRIRREAEEAGMDAAQAGRANGPV